MAENTAASRCDICHSDYEEGDVLRSLPCAHEFHQACVDRWLTEESKACPLCRFDIYTIPHPLLEMPELELITD